MKSMPAFAHGLSEMASVTSPVQISGRYSNSLDFDQYLLAASPPGFTYNVLSKSGGYDSIANYGCKGSDNHYLASSDWYSSSQSHGTSIKGSKHEQQLKLLTNAEPPPNSSTGNAKTLEANRRSMSHTSVSTNNTTRPSR